METAITEHVTELFGLLIIAGMTVFIQRTKKALKKKGMDVEALYDMLVLAEEVLDELTDITRSLYPDLKPTVKEMKELTGSMRTLLDDPKGNPEEVLEVLQQFKGLASYAEGIMKEVKK